MGKLFAGRKLVSFCCARFRRGRIADWPINGVMLYTCFTPCHFECKFIEAIGTEIRRGGWAMVCLRDNCVIPLGIDKSYLWRASYFCNVFLLGMAGHRLILIRGNMHSNMNTIQHRISLYSTAFL